MASAQLVNPKAIMEQYVDLKSKELLNPPHTYEYNDTSIEPNFLKATATIKVGDASNEGSHHAHLAAPCCTAHLSCHAQCSVAQYCYAVRSSRDSNDIVWDNTAGSKHSL
jgi:hypothetical protein